MKKCPTSVLVGVGLWVLAQVGPWIGAGAHLFWRRWDAGLVQVGIAFGAGETLDWRRWDAFWAQVRFLAGDLLHKSSVCDFPWRRSHPFFHTCSITPFHLRHRTLSPAPAHPFTCASTPFHLRQHTLSPAPAHPFTCASIPFHLCQHALSPAPSHPFTCLRIPYHLCQHALPSAPAPLSSSQCPSMVPVGVGLWVVAQVDIAFGAGENLDWRRWDAFLAQVRFLVGDLRRKSGVCGLLWRRSHLFFHTCTSIPHHLHQHTPSPAPAYPPSPAPAYPITCTSIPHHLRQHALSPAPAYLVTCLSIPITCASTPFHLRQDTLSPAPGHPFTCASAPFHLRQHTLPPAPICLIDHGFP